MARARPICPEAQFGGAQWDFKHNGNPIGLNVANDLAEALKTNPRLRIMVNGGYYDLATPFFAAQYEEKHLPIPQSLAKNIEYDWYESGHMVYVRDEASSSLHDRVAAFIKSTETLPPFSLEVLQTANFNIKLTVGSSSDHRERLGRRADPQHHRPHLDSTFTANTIQNFPLNGLDFSALTLYVPGAVNTYGTGGMTSIERSTYYTDTPNINGNRAQANNYTLDGIDMNETFNNLISYSPAPEALKRSR
jgi:hypothetical protein